MGVACRDRLVFPPCAVVVASGLLWVCAGREEAAESTHGAAPLRCPRPQFSARLMFTARFRNMLSSHCAFFLKLLSLGSEVTLEKSKLKSQNLGLPKIKAKSLYILRVIKNIPLPNSPKFFGRKCSSHCDSVVPSGTSRFPPALPAPPTAAPDGAAARSLRALRTTRSASRSLSIVFFILRGEAKGLKYQKEQGYYF